MSRRATRAAVPGLLRAGPVMCCFAFAVLGCGGGARAPSGRQQEGLRRAPTGWEARGPGGGGALFSPSINPHRGREIFMSSDMSGVYHTTDFGATWEMLPFRSLHGSVSTQVRFTAVPDVLYAVNVPGGLRMRRER